MWSERPGERVGRGKAGRERRTRERERERTLIHCSAYVPAASLENGGLSVISPTEKKNKQ